MRIPALTLLMISAACGGSPPASEPTPIAVAPPESSPSPSPTPTPTPTPTTTTTPTPTPTTTTTTTPSPNPTPELTLTRITRLPLDGFVDASVPRVHLGPLRLSKTSSRRNQVTDVDAWMTRHGFTAPKTYAASLADIPTERRQVAGVPLTARFPGQLYLYDDRQGKVVLVGHTTAGSPVFAFDLSDVAAPFTAPVSKREHVTMGVKHAVLDGDVLFLSVAHNGYASTTDGDNAYVLALEVPAGRLLWSSQPLVANAENFVVRANHIISGYGFTAEPDYLYVLDKATGEITGRTKLKKGPEYLFERDSTLYVRTYDRDLELTVE